MLFAQGTQKCPNSILPVTFLFWEVCEGDATEGTIGKEMNLLLSVELGLKTTMQSTLHLISWPTDPSPLSLAKFRSSHYLGWLHERTKGEESTREEEFHIHIVELFTHSVH